VVLPKPFPYIKSRGLWILNGAREGTYSYEEPDVKHGALTYHLLRALDGAVATKDGVVRFDAIAEYVSREVPLLTKERSPNQVPTKSAFEVTGDPVLAVIDEAAFHPKTATVEPMAEGSTITQVPAIKPNKVVGGSGQKQPERLSDLQMMLRIKDAIKEVGTLTVLFSLPAEDQAEEFNNAQSLMVSMSALISTACNDQPRRCLFVSHHQNTRDLDRPAIKPSSLSGIVIHGKGAAGLAEALGNWYEVYHSSQIPPQVEKYYRLPDTGNIVWLEIGPGSPLKR
jgi:hypothetical protein